MGDPVWCGGIGESIMWGEAHSSKGLPLHNDRCLDGENLGGLKAATP